MTDCGVNRYHRRCFPKAEKKIEKSPSKITFVRNCPDSSILQKDYVVAIPSRKYLEPDFPSVDRSERLDPGKPVIIQPLDCSSTPSTSSSCVSFNSTYRVCSQIANIRADLSDISIQSIIPRIGQSKMTRAYKQGLQNSLNFEHDEKMFDALPSLDVNEKQWLLQNRLKRTGVAEKVPVSLSCHYHYPCDGKAEESKTQRSSETCRQVGSEMDKEGGKCPEGIPMTFSSLEDNESGTRGTRESCCTSSPPSLETDLDLEADTQNDKRDNFFARRLSTFSQWNQGQN